MSETNETRDLFNYSLLLLAASLFWAIIGVHFLVWFYGSISIFLAGRLIIRMLRFTS